MFVTFNLTLPDDAFNEENREENPYEKKGYKIRDRARDQLHEGLEKYLLDNGSYDASQIEEDWFPSIDDAQVFLSHSHADESKVIRFAGYLQEECGITSFIDSTVWKHSDDLLKEYDDKHCVAQRNPDGSIQSYNYNKRNQSTAHIHLLLQGALAKMIDHCECLIFINTPNSIPYSNNDKAKTASPWIYNELLIAHLLKNKIRIPGAHGLLYTLPGNIFYTVPLHQFTNIDWHDFAEAKRLVGRKDPYMILRKLYQIKEIF